MNVAEKIKENRLRRAAARQGLTLSKSRRRDPRALDFQRWQVLGANGEPVVADLDLDAVELFLATGAARYR